MNLISFFTENGVPKTGLSPTITITKLDGTVVVSSASMTEVGSGFYYYDFSAYDNAEDYVYLADGGATLNNSERYTTGTNNNQDSIDARKIIKNKAISSTSTNKLTIYDDDGSTELFEYDLQDDSGNPSATTPFRRIPV
jgi:hypothetical protein